MPSLFTNEVAVAFARVAVERAVDRYPEGLTYGIPPSLKGLTEGERVLVPLGKSNKATAGYIIEIEPDSDLDAEQVKFVLQRDESAARLPGQLIELARWISGYYCTPIGMTLASMLPAAVKRNVGSVRKTMINLGAAPVPDRKLPPKQRHVLEVLTALPPHERPVELHALVEMVGLQTSGPIKALLQRGLLEASRRTVVEAAWAEHATDGRSPSSLTSEQVAAVEAIGRTLDKGFSTHLVHGVTGSGKTEVYIQLIRRTLDQGRVAMLLVPEISLTPQTGGRLIGRFPNHRVAVLHSGLTSAQRHQQWAMAAEGQADIVLGARSAVFAPVPDNRLGLIVVDEEHDGSYKQDQAPRYHGRDVAIRRAQLSECPIVLGSATPSLESWHNATVRRNFALHTLRQRVPGMKLPRVQVVDFREQIKQRKDRHVHLLGPVLEAAIGRTLDAGGQVLLLLNRRGYASYIACPSSICGWVMNCDHCDVTTVYHLSKKLPAGGYVQCHHCLAEQKLPPACPQCGGRLSTFGLGTQRVEEELERKFPQLIEGKTMLRMDSDSMDGSAAFHMALDRFGRGEVRLLVGTQMIAKGLDFPGVRLVGVINADTSINLPDFRASERTFQLVNQVAGRAGRSADPGTTIVQTFNPELPAIQLAAKHDYETFAAQELEGREQCGLPPITRMARVVVRDEDHVKCVASANRLARGLHELKDAGGSHGPHAEVRLRGPAPCPIARIADRHRQQVEIIAPNAAALQRFVAAARTAGLLHSGVDMAVDVDPVALM